MNRFQGNLVSTYVRQLYKPMVLNWSFTDQCQFTSVNQWKSLIENILLIDRCDAKVLLKHFRIRNGSVLKNVPSGMVTVKRNESF